MSRKELDLEAPVISAPMSRTNISQKKGSDYEFLSVHQLTQIPESRCAGVVEIVLNLIGATSRLIASTLSCCDKHGATIVSSFTVACFYAAACIFSGIAFSNYAFGFYKGKDSFGVFALLQLSVGCLIFFLCAFLYLVPEYATISLVGFFAASFLFLTGSIVSQIQNGSWAGLLAPLLPCSNWSVLSISWSATLGSVLFVLGSIFLFYDWGEVSGAWCYEIGSVGFLLAAWGDATIWNRGHLQSGLS